MVPVRQILQCHKNVTIAGITQEHLTGVVASDMSVTSLELQGSLIQKSPPAATSNTE